MAKKRMATQVSDVGDAATVGRLLIESGMFPGTTSAAQAAVRVLAGREVGIGPVQAMVGLQLVDGAIVLAASLMAALILRSGRYDYRVVQHDDEVCALEFFRDGKSVGTSQYSINEARVTGVASPSNWKCRPRDMLFDRAMSNGARCYCADVFGGPVYTADDVHGAEPVAFAVTAGEIIDVEFTAITPAHSDDAGLARLAELIAATGTNLDLLLGYYGVRALHELADEQRQHALDELLKRSAQNTNS